MHLQCCLRGNAAEPAGKMSAYVVHLGRGGVGWGKGVGLAHGRCSAPSPYFVCILSGAIGSVCVGVVLQDFHSTAFSFALFPAFLLHAHTYTFSYAHTYIFSYVHTHIHTFSIGLHTQVCNLHTVSVGVHINTLCSTHPNIAPPPPSR